MDNNKGSNQEDLSNENKINLDDNQNKQNIPKNENDQFKGGEAF